MKCLIITSGMSRRDHLQSHSEQQRSACTEALGQLCLHGLAAEQLHLPPQPRSSAQSYDEDRAEGAVQSHATEVLLHRFVELATARQSAVYIEKQGQPWRAAGVPNLCGLLLPPYVRHRQRRAFRQPEARRFVRWIVRDVCAAREERRGDARRILRSLAVSHSRAHMRTTAQHRQQGPQHTDRQQQGRRQQGQHLCSLAVSHAAVCVALSLRVSSGRGRKRILCVSRAKPRCFAAGIVHIYVGRRALHLVVQQLDACRGRRQHDSRLDHCSDVVQLEERRVSLRSAVGTTRGTLAATSTPQSSSTQVLTLRCAGSPSWCSAIAGAAKSTKSSAERDRRQLHCSAREINVTQRERRAHKCRAR